MLAATDDRRRRLRRRLLTWYRAQPRPLPWRDTRDPWRILVSELMLQQTQAARVAPLWESFCARFPTPAALAGAPVGEALVRWRGLGYNRRAVNLHRAASAIVADHGGAVPDDLDALRALPGVGEYTARAVLAFAFERDAAPVDTNVARVLARAVTGAPLRGRALQALADELVPAGDGHAWSQALMDLGARVCTARAPRCEACPLAGDCAWRRAGDGSDPVGGAAAARRQTPFAGSDRYHRGRLVDALRAGPLEASGLPAAAQLQDRARAEALSAALVADGLAEWSGGRLQLPGGGLEAAPTGHLARGDPG